MDRDVRCAGACQLWHMGDASNRCAGDGQPCFACGYGLFSRFWTDLYAALWLSLSQWQLCAALDSLAGLALDYCDPDLALVSRSTLKYDPHAFATSPSRFSALSGLAWQRPLLADLSVCLCLYAYPTPANQVGDV